MIYRIILSLRHLFYDKGWKKSFEASVPTVCVGNITAGGTGKTPFTELILRKLLKSDAWAYSNIALLSRGYKRSSRGFQIVPREGTARAFGDEPLQIARKFPSVTVAVDKDRVRGCSKLASGIGEEVSSASLRDSANVPGKGPSSSPVPQANIIVLDDAFQYRRLRAKLNIVLVDYNRPIFKDKLMPWGRLRDLPSRLQKADIVVVTKCPAEIGDWDRQEFRRRLRLQEGQKLFFSTIGYGTPEPVFDEADSRYIYSSRLVLVTGIANDAPLRGYLSDTYKIARRIAFPDHHRFTKADVRTLAAAVRENPTACLMTTEKDAQRLRDLESAIPDAVRARLFYIPIETSFLSGEEDAAFTAALLSSL